MTDESQSPQSTQTESPSDDYEIVSIICSGCHEPYYFQSRGADFDYRLMGCCNEREYMTLTCKATEGKYFQQKIKNVRLFT